MKYKALVALLLLSSLVFIGPACNRASYGADDPSKIHVGIVFDIGGKDDRSFNAAGPKSGFQAGCLIFSKKPSYSPARMSEAA